MRKAPFLLIILALASSCQKEADFQNGMPQSGDTLSNDYQPTSAGSEWNYKSTSLGDYTIRSLGTDSAVNGEKFYRFDHSIGGRQYISKKDGVYTEMANLVQVGGWVSSVYLKDVAAGSVWETTLGPADMHYLVAGRGIKRTVNGKQYSNVLFIKFEQYVTGLKTGSGEQYYAKGVGAIEGISRFDFMGSQTTIDSTYLASADIK